MKNKYEKDNIVSKVFVAFFLYSIYLLCNTVLFFIIYVAY